MAGVMRTRRRFGMVLDGERREVETTQSLQGPVVEVPVRQRDTAELAVNDRRRGRNAAGRRSLPAPTSRIHRESVVVRRDLDAARLEILDRLVDAPVSEPEL